MTKDYHYFECGHEPHHARGMCRKCYDAWMGSKPERKAQMRAWREANPNYIRQWQLDHPEKCREYARKHYAKLFRRYE